MSTISRHRSINTNPIALRHSKVGIGNKSLKDILQRQSNLKTQKARESGLPKSKYYRQSLEPYIGKQVQLVFRKWHVNGHDNDKIWLALEYGELIYVKDVRNLPREQVKHMLVLTDKSWMEFNKPKHDQGIRVNGFLYEYINYKKQCINIGVWAISLTPQDFESQPAK